MLVVDPDPKDSVLGADPKLNDGADAVTAGTIALPKLNDGAGISVSFCDDNPKPIVLEAFEAALKLKGVLDGGINDFDGASGFASEVIFAGAANRLFVLDNVSDCSVTFKKFVLAASAIDGRGLALFSERFEVGLPISWPLLPKENPFVFDDVEANENPLDGVVVDDVTNVNPSEGLLV